MGFFDGFKLGIIDAMTKSGEFPAVKITDEFQPKPQENPLISRTICVGFAEIKSETSGTAQYLGVSSGSSDEVFGKNVSILASFKIFAPTKQGGIACHEVFSMLADYFLLKQSIYRVSSFFCGDIAYDRAVGAYALTVTAEIKTTAVCDSGEGDIFENIIVRRVR